MHGVISPRDENPATLLALSYQHLLDRLPWPVVLTTDILPPVPQQAPPDDDYGRSVVRYQSAVDALTLHTRPELDRFLASGARPADVDGADGPRIVGDKVITGKAPESQTGQQVSVAWGTGPSADKAGGEVRSELPAPAPPRQLPEDIDAPPPNLKPATPTHTFIDGGQA